MRITPAPFLVVLMLCASACGGDGGNSGGGDNPDPVKARNLMVWSIDVTIDAPYIPALAVGRTLDLSAAALDSTSTEIPGSASEIRWSTSDPTLAAITHTSGRSTQVTALAPGRVTVTATFSGTHREVPLVVAKGYTLTEFSSPRPWERVLVTNLNEHGHVVGSLDGHPFTGRAFLWKDGAVIELGIPESVAWDVNDNGQVVGSFNSKPNTIPNLIHPFSWRDGQMTDLAPGLEEHTHAVAINNQGEVAGYTNALWMTGGEPARAMLWRNGQLSELGTFTGRAAYALDINPQGDVVGFYTPASGIDVPFLLHEGQLSSLSVKMGSGQAVAVSEEGTIVGNNDDGAFVWKAGTMTYLPPNFDLAMRVSDVNRHGQVVGHAEARPGRPLSPPRAFLWLDGTAMDLSGLVVQRGAPLRHARAINDRGQIAVETERGGALLTPVP
ncbi:Ig-like domain-containing protein [Archangium lipolyticum]|uniref:Ig-like domain-containing protein n=1 Tax=Archangium lipolyticum TaxID=2970465 RepID=UPI002149E7EF|nr:Ig-like domain-containing protein [Archangium lipolyticum]